jgi:hypothetical protein
MTDWTQGFILFMIPRIVAVIGLITLLYILI